MPSQPGSEAVLVAAQAASYRERSAELLRDSVTAGSAALWGETISHAMVDSAIALADQTSASFCYSCGHRDGSHDKNCPMLARRS